MRWLSAIVMAAMLAGCAGGTPLPSPPTGPVPDLIGTWRGTWGGEPVTLLVLEQTGDAGYSGIFVSADHLMGPRRPGVSGVLTSSIRGVAAGARAQGWLGNDASGRLLLLVQAEPPDGLQRLTLVRVGDDQLQGTGESSFRWGPKGPARLTRQPR